MSTKTLSLAVVIFFLFTFAGFVTSSTARESVEAFSFRPITLKEGIEPEAYEKVIKEFPSVEGLIPGVKFLLMKGDRGINKGKYIGLWVYDSVNTRNFYFPEEGESLWEAWMGASGGLLQQMMDKMRKYVQPTDPSTRGDVTDYVAIKLMQKRKPICTMSIEENKAIVRRVFEEVWNQRKLDVVDDIFATDHIFHDPFAGNVKGIEGYKQLVSRNITAFPDGQFTIEEQVAEGDKVATRWTGTGTHKGELMGIPPTNVQVTLTGIGISHIVGGKIVEGWTSWDVLGMLQQLGVVSPIGEAAKK